MELPSFGWTAESESLSSVVLFFLIDVDDETTSSAPLIEEDESIFRS